MNAGLKRPANAVYVQLKTYQDTSTRAGPNMCRRSLACFRNKHLLAQKRATHLSQMTLRRPVEDTRPLCAMQASSNAAAADTVPFEIWVPWCVVGLTQRNLKRNRLQQDELNVDSSCARGSILHFCGLSFNEQCSCTALRLGIVQVLLGCEAV